MYRQKCKNVVKIMILSLIIDIFVRTLIQNVPISADTYADTAHREACGQAAVPPVFFFIPKI